MLCKCHWDRLKIVISLMTTYVSTRLMITTENCLDINFYKIKIGENTLAFDHRFGDFGQLV